VSGNAVKNAILLILTGAMLTGLAFHLSASPQVANPPPPSQAERDMEERQQKLANKRRQEDLQKDTDKLFVLASELKDAVGKSNENTLSLEVVRKAEEVEKLAKRVKDKMREGTGKPMKAEPLVVDPRHEHQ